MFKVGNYPNDTGLFSVSLFNRSVPEFRTSKHPEVGLLTLALNV